MYTLTRQQKQAIASATIASLIFAAFFLRNYFTMFVFSGILAYLFWPAFTYYRRKFKEGTSIMLTFFTTAIVVIIPITLLIIIAVTQLSKQVDSISQLASTADLSKVGETVVKIINDFLAHVPFVHLQVTEESLINFIKNLSDNISSAVVSYAKNAVGSIFGLFTSFIIFIFVYISAIKNGQKIIEISNEINPLGVDISKMYMSKIAAMVKGTVRGQFVIAIAQGFMSALLLAFAGLGNYFSVFFILLTAMSVIPLGAGIITIPIGVVMILFGNITGGIVVIAGHLILTTNIDNILRPILVPKEARLDPALMLVSVFAGIGMFGFLGIVIGPTLMIIVVTTVKVYLEVFKDYEILPDDIDQQQKRTLKSKIKKALTFNK